MLILVVGPSGAGKDTLLDAARAALRDDARFRFVRREITRAVAAGGEAHIQVDAETFAWRRSAGHYALHWEAHGLGYGIPADIADDLAGGRIVIANVSRAVIAEAAWRFPVRIIEITAPNDTLAQRLAARGREDAVDITARLQRSLELPKDAEVISIVNDSTIEQAARQLLAALREAAESARSARTEHQAPPA
jgi:ribose 1,5-bisphosphokinase